MHLTLTPNPFLPLTIAVHTDGGCWVGLVVWLNATIVTWSPISVLTRLVSRHRAAILMCSTMLPVHWTSVENTSGDCRARNLLSCQTVWYVSARGMSALYMSCRNVCRVNVADGCLLRTMCSVSRWVVQWTVQITVSQVHKVTQGDQHCIPALRKSGLSDHTLSWRSVQYINHFISCVCETDCEI